MAGGLCDNIYTREHSLQSYFFVLQMIPSMNGPVRMGSIVIPSSLCSHNVLHCTVFVTDDGGMRDMDVNMRDIRLLFVNVPAVW